MIPIRPFGGGAKIANIRNTLMTSKSETSQVAWTRAVFEEGCRPGVDRIHSASISDKHERVRIRLEDMDVLLRVRYLIKCAGDLNKVHGRIGGSSWLAMMNRSSFSQFVIRSV